MRRAFAGAAGEAVRRSNASTRATPSKSMQAAGTPCPTNQSRMTRRRAAGAGTPPPPERGPLWAQRLIAVYLDVLAHTNKARIVASRYYLAIPAITDKDRADLRGVQEGDHYALCTSAPAVQENDGGIG